MFAWNITSRTAQDLASGSKSLEDYLKNIAEIKEILKGNTQEIQRMLFQQMQELAAEMKFEEAQKIKKKIPAAGKLPCQIGSGKQRSAQYRRVLHRGRQRWQSPHFINYLHITNGAINQAFTFEYKKRLNESKEELLSLGIIEMRERYKSLSREIIVPFELDMELKDVDLYHPATGG